MLRITKTENGMVRGLPAADTWITAFKGIPFAAPPVGKNRWRVPQPAENWEGIRDCFRFGPIPMQDVPSGNGFYDKEWHNDPARDCMAEMSEDCLYLNVWTPAKSAEERLPVMVWIFGGGLNWGHPQEMEFDGERIARRDVVIVSVGYRLNAFGFMAHPEITAENGGVNCANFGLYDQKAGIDWVRRNIQNFGGDPDNITIFGQSAGGRSTLCQILTPLNENNGITHAITQSGGGLSFHSGNFSGGYPTLAEAEEGGVKFLEYLGVKNIEEARQIDAETLRDKASAFRNAGIHRWGLCVDGTFLPDQPNKMLAENRRLQIPVMVGNTDDEFRDVFNTENPEAFEASVKTVLGEDADEFFRLCGYPEADFAEVQKAAKLNGSCFGARLLSMRGADAGLPMYFYSFGPEIPGEDHPGAFHSSELWFTFETLAKCWRPFVGKHYDLARQMCNYWTNFAKTGNPNGLDADGTPMPEWTPFTKDAPEGITFRESSAMDTAARHPAIDFLYETAAKRLWRK
ncbi:MAG: carboxylesterase family protein [Ruminococcaceae bacterium]|nr:carboxylesterase family protein [Oscillospiraceae bacterium]